MNQNTIDHYRRAVEASEAIRDADGNTTQHDERLAALHTYFVENHTVLDANSPNHIDRWTAGLPDQVRAFLRRRGLI